MQPRSYLINSAKDVSVVLLESAHASEAGEGTGKLVAVQDTKIGHAPWQVPEVGVGVGKDLAVPRAVHGLHAVLLLLDLKHKHVLGVVAPVTRRLPEIRLVHVGGHDLLEISLAVLVLDDVHQGVVDAGSVREEKGRTGGHLVKEEELLVLSNLAMIALGSLGKEQLVLFQSLLIGERDTRDTLDGLVLAVTKPVRGRALSYIS